MATDVERLIARLEVQQNQFERQMRRAQQTTNRAARNIETRFQRTNQTVTAQFAAMGRGIVGALGPVMGIGAGAFTAAGIVRGVRGAVSELSALGKTARDVGLDVEELQALMRGFERNSRVSGDQAASAFERFNRRVGDAVHGTGELNTVVKRYGLELRTADGALRSNSELLRDVARLMRDARNEQERAAIGMQAFGDVGRQMAQAMAEGPEALDRMIEQAIEAGHVVDRELIARAKDLDDRFNDLTLTVSIFFKSLAIDVASGGEAIAEFMQRMGQLGDPFSDAGGRIFDLLRIDAETATSSVDLLKQALLNSVEALQQASSSMGLPGAREGQDAIIGLIGEVQVLEDALADGAVSANEADTALETVAQQAIETLRELNGVDDARFDGVIDALSGLINQIAAARAEASALKAELPGAAGGVRVTEDPGADAPRPRARPIDWLPGDGGRSGGSRSRGGGGGAGAARQSAFDMGVQQIRERTAALEAEAVALIAAAASGQEYGQAIMYAYERARLLHAAQKDGLQITPELEARIDELASAYARAGDAARTAAEQMREAQDNAERGAQAMADLFGGIMSGATSAKQALGRLLQQIAQVQLQKAFMGLSASGGGGGFFGFLGGLLGFAGGGYTGPGGKHEPAGVVHGGEYVFSKAAVDKIGVGNLDALHRQLKGFASGGYVGRAVGASVGGAANISMTIDVRGARGNTEIAQMVQEGLTQGFRKLKTEMPDMVQAINKRPRYRPA